MGARSARPVPPDKRDEPQPQRAGDRPGYYADAWLRNLAWPVSLLALGLIAIATAVYFRYGPQQASAWLEWLSGPAFLAAVGVLAAAGVAVVRKVQQMAKAEMWSATAASTAASTKAEVTSSQDETRRLIAGVVRLVEQQGSTGREPDPDTGEIEALVLELRERMQRIEERSTTTQDLLIAHGAQLGRAVMTLTTGQLRAQDVATVREAALNRGRSPLYAPSGEPGTSRVTPEATPPPAQAPGPAQRPGRAAPLDPLDTDFPHHRDATAEQPAVTTDEHEDWQPADPDEGPGLPTGIRADFRAAMRAAQQGDLDDQLAAPPAREPVEPEVIRRAREQARAREELRRRWTDPEEGPR